MSSPSASIRVFTSNRRFVPARRVVCGARAGASAGHRRRQRRARRRHRRRRRHHSHARRVRRRHGAPPRASGSFSLAPIAPGRYEVEAAMPLFDSARVLIDVPQGGEVPPVRLVMEVAGLVESMVVTGRRTETRLAETPQKIELIDARDIERIGRGRHHRRPEEELRRRGRAVQRRAVGHRHPRVPSGDVRPEQAIAAAHRRPAVRRHQPVDAHARQRRAHRGAQGPGVGDLRRVGDGRGRQRHHASIARPRHRRRPRRLRPLQHVRAWRPRRRQPGTARRFRRQRHRRSTSATTSAWATAS